MALQGLFYALGWTSLTFPSPHTQNETLGHFTLVPVPCQGLASREKMVAERCANEIKIP